MDSLIGNDKELKCLDCFTSYAGKFCPDCGQKSTVRRFSILSIKDELFKKFMPWNTKIVYTLKKILLSPNSTIQKYLEGKRVKYTSPFILYLSLVAMVIATAHFFNYNLYIDIPISKTPSKGASIIALAYFQTTTTLSTIFRNASEYFDILELIFFSFITKWIFKKANLYYGEHFIINVFAGIRQIFLTLIFIPFLTIFQGQYQDVHDFLYIFILLPLKKSLYIYTYFTFFQKYYEVKFFLLLRIAVFMILAIVVNYLLGGIFSLLIFLYHLIVLYL